jgi:hypothetical protein
MVELPEEPRAAVEPLLTAHERVCARIDLVDKKVAKAVADVSTCAIGAQRAIALAKLS